MKKREENLQILINENTDFQPKSPWFSSYIRLGYCLCIAYSVYGNCIYHLLIDDKAKILPCNKTLSFV